MISRERTTSACAENTQNPLIKRVFPGNYLRVRGEYLIGVKGKWVAKELPPRARRILTILRPMKIQVGTTSACAENTASSLRSADSSWNYLRVRGEYFGGRTISGGDWELPPRARRIRNLNKQRRRRDGTTSACAENTNINNRWGGHNGNYLRVRGEYHDNHQGCCPDWELPPRARRIPADERHEPRSEGTTSACAENTHYGDPRHTTFGNYLRVRGEYSPGAARPP